MSKLTKAGSGALHKLAPRQVLAAKQGELSDGGGLTLRASAAGASWVLRFTAPSGRRREMGLGVAHIASLAQAGASLTEARDAAQKARELLRQGIDPIEHRDQQRQAALDAIAERKAQQVLEQAQEAREQTTLARVARSYHERVIEPNRTGKHGADWIASLENHLPAELWHAPVDSIEPPALLAVLQAIKPHARARRLTSDERLQETVRRIRQRLDAVFEDAIFHKLCNSNPAAAIKRKLREANGKRKRGSLLALAYAEAPNLMKRIAAAEGVAARCLELAVLTAARTGEVLLAEWSEFDLDAGVWQVPAERMKGGESHTVYLPTRAVEVLRSLQGVHERWVFPSPMLAHKPLSNMAMLVTLDRLGVRDKTTVHGLCRATFSTWANETGAARPDVIEACLAHEEGNRVRAAYNRAKFNEERKSLLQAWADYLQREPAQVVPIKGGIKTA